MKLEDLLDNSLNISISKLITHLITQNLLLNNKMQLILEMQLQTLELLKEKTGEELNDMVYKNLEDINKLITDTTKESVIDTLNSLMVD